MALPLLAFAALSAIQAINGLKNADAIRNQNDLNKGLADIDAKYLELDAWKAEQFGYTSVARYQNVVDSVLSDQRVAYASQNVDVSSGTAALVQKQTQRTGFLNGLDMLKESRNRAQGLKNEALRVRMGATLGHDAGELQARGAEYAGYSAAANTLGKGLSSYLEIAAKDRGDVVPKGRAEPMTDDNAPFNNPYGTVASNGTTATSEYVVDHWRRAVGGPWERVS